MHPLLKIFLDGMLVSFLGSLPLGTLNIAAMQISVSDGIQAAIMFSIGSLIAEIIYARLSLVAMDWIRKQERILKNTRMGNACYRCCIGDRKFLCGYASQ